MNRGSLDDARKLVVDAIGASMRPRFMNRGSASVNAGEAAYSRASMRPRFMNRGSLVQLRAESELEACGFNEAPIHESGKCVARRTLADGHELASMRPRFMNRGSATGLTKYQESW